MKQQTFLIPVDPLFSFEECLWFLNRGFDDCMHAIEGDTVVKALPVKGNPCLFRISAAADALKVDILAGDYSKESIADVISFIREWFDLERDLQPFYSLLQKEEKLAYMVESFRGLKLIGIVDLFEALCWGIIGQQINLAFAYRLKRRLVEHYGQMVAFGEKEYYLFPEPAVMAKADIETLKSMQYSQKKAEYLTGVARIFEHGTVSKSVLQGVAALEEQQQALTSIRGIGVWTANYALMKSLKITKAIPYGDAGLLQALVNHSLISGRKDQAGMDKLFRRFKGWEAYLVFYLWRSLAVNK